MNMKYLKIGNEFINLNCTGSICFRDENYTVCLTIISDDVTEVKFVPGKYEQVKLLISDFLFNSTELLDLTNFVRVEGQEIVIDKELLDYIFVDVAKMLVLQQNASVSLIQRKFNINFNRADRIMETLVEAQIVSNVQEDGSRKVFFANEADLISHLKAIGLQV